jgi:hypothetical protein
MVGCGDRATRSVALPPHTHRARPSVNNAQAIMAALQALLLRRSDEQPNVVIVHEPSGKFVQFTGSATEQLVLDLPWPPLSEIEFYRAVRYFKQFGVVGEEHDVFNMPGGEVVDQWFIFNMSFRSVDAAVETALGVFSRVYQLPANGDLQVKKSWGE